MNQRPAYELMPVAISNPEDLLADMDLYLIDGKREASGGRKLCERSATRHEKAYSSEAEPRHRLGNDLEPDR